MTSKNYQNCFYTYMVTTKIAEIWHVKLLNERVFNIELNILVEQENFWPAKRWFSVVGKTWQQNTGFLRICFSYDNAFSHNAMIKSSNMILKFFILHLKLLFSHWLLSGQFWAGVYIFLEKSPPLHLFLKSFFKSFFLGG